MKLRTVKSKQWFTDFHKIATVRYGCEKYKQL